MERTFLANLVFESQPSTLVVLAFLAAIFLRPVPSALKGRSGLCAVICLFPGDRVANALRGMVATFLGPILTLGIAFLGLRLIVSGGRSRCSRCGCRCKGCDCR